jgi:hypothetical protein
MLTLTSYTMNIKMKIGARRLKTHPLGRERLVLNDAQLLDAMSSIHHKLEETLSDLSIADQQFPDSKDMAVHSFSFLFTQEEYMFVMYPNAPRQSPLAVMIS